MTKTKVKNVTTTHSPINIQGLSELVQSGIPVDMLLQYETDESTGHFEVFLKYNRTVIRQLFTSYNNTPRTFKDINRAFSFGKEHGLRSVSTSFFFEEFIPKIHTKSNDEQHEDQLEDIDQI